MRAFVFTDSSLARHAGQFVWLAVDIDDPANSAFLVKFPVTGTPTLMVIDPRTETVALRYVGSASVPQLEQLFRDGADLV
ncbi:MAG TPA: thiol reductase thioredoxin, partial [Thermoanaerobaculia bacterium]